MRQTFRASLRYLLVAAALLVAGPALGQQSVSDKAAAEALFDEALKLMKDKRYDEACPKLEESQRIDAGIGTMLYLAECYEKSGRTASAWATFREAASAASAAGQTERAIQGKQRADQLEPDLSKLTIMVASENRSLNGFQVTRAGQLVPAPIYDTAVPVDPGDLQIEASAPGYKSLSKTVTVAPGGARAVVEIPALVAEAPVAGAAPPPAESSEQAWDEGSSEGEPSESAAPGDASADDGSTMRTVGVVTMGVGGLGLVIGGLFGVQAINKDKDADDYCGETTCRSEQGAELSDKAQQAATVSTVAFAVGGAALLGGAIVYFLAPEAPQAGALGVAPVPGGAHLSYQGRF